MLIDQFDEMRRRSEDTPLVLGLSLHTFIVGQPFRIVHLRRAREHMLAHRDRLWVTMPSEISRSTARCRLRRSCRWSRSHGHDRAIALLGADCAASGNGRLTTYG
jgi:hypothetical protein